MSAVCRSLVLLALIPSVPCWIGPCVAAPQATDGAAGSGVSIQGIDPGFCIIQPDEPASIEIFADYDGHRFYFCCELCRQDFLSDPSRFDGLVPTDDAVELDQWNSGPDPYAHTFWGRVGRVILAVQSAERWVYQTLHLRDPLSAVLAGVAAIWLAIVAYQWRAKKRKQIGFRPSIQIAALVTLIFAPCFYANSLRLALSETTQLHEESERDRLSLKDQFDEVVDRDHIHYATFFNYGNPPVPRPSKLPPSLKKTYYRGNDERSDLMVNGGNYRTVTFELWIEDASGEVVVRGTELRGPDGKPKGLFLGVRFIRAPETSSGYFTDEYMRRMYLTMQAGDFLGRDEPVVDRVQWEMTEHEQVWEARIRLPEGVIVKEKPRFDGASEYVRTIDLSRPDDRGGIVYLCEDRFAHDQMIGGRFHYAVQYDLRAKDGIVAPGSDLWMQATYHGRNFADLQIENDEWLSNEPIPEK